MSRIRLLIAKWHCDDAVIVLGSVDQTVWDHWDDESEARWITDCRALFGADATDYEVRQAWAQLDKDALQAVFETVEIPGVVEGSNP